MDFLIELVIEIVGGIAEIFFGEIPLKKLPRPLRFILLFGFWFGLAAFFGWLSYISFSSARALSVIFFVAVAAFILLGVYYISKSMKNEKKEESVLESGKETRRDGDASKL